MSDSVEKLRDVIVVGAGLGGLSSALLLQKHGLDVVVLEAQSHVGGRTLTEVDPKLGSLNLGAENIPPNHHELLELIHEMGVSPYMQKAKQEKIWLENDDHINYRYFYPRFWNLFINLDFNCTIRKLNRLMEQVPVDKPWESSKASYLDSISVKDWAEKHVWTRSVYGFLLYACRMNLTIHDPAQVSMLYFLWFLKQFTGLISFFPSRDPTMMKSELKVRGGTQQICTNAAVKLGVDAVHKNSPVTSIEQMADKVVVTTTNGKQGKHVTTNVKQVFQILTCGKYVVVAIPISVFHRVSFTPSLPNERMSVIRAMLPSSCMKSMICYGQKLWNTSGVTKSIICADENSPVFSSSLYADGENSTVTVMSTGKVNGFGKKTPKERKDFLCQFIHKAYGSSEVAFHPVKYAEKTWMSDPYAEGVVVGSLPPGVLTKYKFEYKKPFGRLHFAGSEMAHKWVGQMAGGVISGQRAAREILHNLGKLPTGVSLEEESQNMKGDVLPPYYLNPVIRNLAPSVGGAVALTVVGAGLSIVLGFCIYKGVEYELRLI